jgi:glycosyltransferase involved in cell wall biosynthesis
MLQNNYIPRVSFVTGIVSPGDAISETLIADISAMDQLGASQRRNLDLQIYCLKSEHYDTRIHVVRDWRDTLNDEHFRTSDIFYFHYGIFSEMHHLMHHVRRDAKLVVFFHNVTQPQYCPIEQESLIHASYQQIRNFRAADYIIAASQFSARQIGGYDLDKDIKVIPLFGPNAPESLPEHGPTIDTTRPLRLLMCGRFVRSKGAASLLAALDQIKASLTRPIELTLAGQTQFSDARYITWLGELAARLKPDITVKFAFDLTPEALRPQFADADAFVLPSLHEGFGMTVAEALIAGTPVICSDAGALPEVSGGYGLTFAAGADAGLASALQAFVSAQRAGMILCDRGPLAPAEWHKQMAGHAHTYLRARYVERMIGEFDALLQPTASWNASARQALADADLFEPGDTLADRLDRAVLDAVAGLQTPIAGSHDWPAAATRKGDGTRSQSRHKTTVHHAVDTICVDLQIAERHRRLHWLGPVHGRIGRTVRFLHELAGKRAYVLGRTRSLIARGNAARNRKDWPEAISNYTKALEIHPAIGSIWVQLGHAFKESGALSDAEMAYNRAAKYLPQNSDLQLQLGHLSKIRGKMADAAYYYSLSLFYDPANLLAVRELKNLGYATDVGRIQAFLGKR